MKIYVYLSTYTVLLPILPFSVYQGRQELVDGISWVHLS
jgi:hypothetical protein